ncbi:MAG: J domain-containing protein [Myxococcota bacterium]|nr:J domain-containing protein [Myxococcota bacterium]
MSSSAHYSAYLADFTLLFRGRRTQQPIPQLLDERSLKRAYKACIFECHPDRAVSVKRNERTLTQRTAELNRAYMRLKELVAHGPVDTRVWLQAQAPRRTVTTSLKTKTRSQPRQSSVVHQPDRPSPVSYMRFGQYLVHAGVITHQVLLSALTWQSTQRPLFGTLAVNLGYLAPHQVAQSLSWKMPRETIGDAAVRLGFIRSDERRDILAEQLRFHAPIGDYLVAQGYLTRGELDILLDQQRAYNAKTMRARRRPVSVKR